MRTARLARERLDSERGFTLVEMLITASLRLENTSPVEKSPMLVLIPRVLFSRTTAPPLVAV